jgi:anthranilate synthase component 1
MKARALCRRLEIVPDPLALFRTLSDGGRRPHTVLLESAQPATGRAERSILMPSAALQVVCRGERVTISTLSAIGAALLPALAKHFEAYEQERGDHSLVLRFPRQKISGTDRERLLAPSVLTALRELAAALRPAVTELPESLFLTGLFAYDLVELFERLPPAEPGDSPDLPDYQFYLADQLVIVDHRTNSTEVMGVVFGDGDEVAARAAVTSLAAGVERCVAEPPLDQVTGREAAVAVEPGDHQFAAGVEQLQRHIGAGDVFQIVPSRTFSLPCADPLAAYRRLRALNPVPYLFFANGGDWVLFGSSPESAVRVEGRTRTVEISPIAGTRPRGKAEDGSIDLELDTRLEAELRLDAKEMAEHMMLVDLARNDVARISRPGTRHVAELLRVERYSHVMHLVSRVRGELADGLDALHAVQASMNMGTLTGAPKLRAMELLRGHEPGRRNHYGGMFGYLLGNGTLDTAIVIRAALVREGVAQVRAGAGVVHDSVPLLEAEETRRKAEAVLRAISAA